MHTYIVDIYILSEVPSAFTPLKKMVVVQVATQVWFESASH